VIIIFYNRHFSALGKACDAQRFSGDHPGFLEAEVTWLSRPYSPDDHMVEQGDLKQKRGLGQFTGEADIGFAGARVARGVIVLCELNAYVAWRCCEVRSAWSEVVRMR